MSRIGNRELIIPAGVTVDINDNVVTVKGSKGELTFPYSKLVTVEVNDGKVITKRINETKTNKYLCFFIGYK